jgi:uncharacterized protein (DUF1800 family)
MALESKTAAALALHRFGLGPRAGSIAAVAADPRGALLADLERLDAGRIAGGSLRSSSEAARAAQAFQRAQREARRVAKGPAPKDGKGEKGDGKESDAAPPGGVPAGVAPQEIYIAEAQARVGAALDAEIGFVERLAWFWSNHFCVSADKAQVRPLAGAFEREAIRANVLGKFFGMLLAVETHPAMLIYLDNARSVGPNSPAGRNRGRGLNENLAREILELHTLGVRSVYTQDDVTSFAKVITGWSVVGPGQDAARTGEFTFNPRMHEPGTQTIIGKAYADAGYDQGRRVLADLARHPATAKHVAGKLARHFIADDPPLSVVESLARTFLDTDGDLKELAKALVATPEAWAPTRGKLKRPGEWVVGMLRASGAKAPDIRPLVQVQILMGEPLWRPPAPNGFADGDATWLNGLSQRLDVANQFARRLAGTLDPKAALEETIGPLASAATRQTILRAESRQQALALLFMAPEFQRR